MSERHSRPAEPGLIVNSIPVELSRIWNAVRRGVRHKQCSATAGGQAP
jgi:hypothetical protein